MENNWISVKDRLPERDVPVLLSYIDYTFDAVFFRTRGIHCDYWSRNDSDGEGNCMLNDPDYWMPLPPPPEDEK